MVLVKQFFPLLLCFSIFPNCLEFFQHLLFKVGKTWVFIIKYFLPVVLIGMWVIGIIKLFSNASLFEVIIDLIIVFCVLLSSIILTKTKISDNM